jgi:hypothetical protein
VLLLPTLQYKLMFFLFHASLAFYQAYHESRATTLGAEADSGDFAQAYKSHHEQPVDGTPELEAESAASMSVAAPVN